MDRQGTISRTSGTIARADDKEVSSIKSKKEVS